MVEALRALAIKKLVLLSPYVQRTNDHERDYLAALGFTVLHDVALGLKGGDEYITVPPERWIEIAHDAMRPQADGLFLSCTNTSQIETIETLERESRRARGQQQPGGAVGGDAASVGQARRRAARTGPRPAAVRSGRREGRCGLQRSPSACWRCVAAAIPAASQTAESFFRGKQIEILVGNAAGGGYDLYRACWRVISARTYRAIPPSWSRTCRAPAG